VGVFVAAGAGVGVAVSGLPHDVQNGWSLVGVPQFGQNFGVSIVIYFSLRCMNTVARERKDSA